MATAADFLAQVLLPLAIIAAIAVIIRQSCTIAELRLENHHLHAAHDGALARLNYDELTGLLNRTGFRRALAARLDVGAPIAVALIDVDGFKAVNDTHGHAAGDLMLRYLAAQLDAARQRTTAPATIARLSGDEFAVLVDGDMPAAQHLAYEITRRLRTGPLPYNGVQIDAHVSVGLTAHTGADEPLTVDDIVARADHAMYHAKRRPDGLPHIATWTPGLHMPPPGEPGDRRTFRQPGPQASR